MKEIFQDSAIFSVILTLSAYTLGTVIRKKTGWCIVNPLIFGIVFIICFILITGISYDSYFKGASFINYLLTPCTVCLAIPLYQQYELLRKNYKAVMAGIMAGIISSGFSVLALAMIFHLSHTEYVTFLSKSITIPIGIGITQELGGYVPMTVVSIALTGMSGTLIADKLLAFLNINEPIAKGIAIGSSTHVMGTAHALELGEIEGAMSGLSIAVCGIITVAAVTFLSWLY